MSSTLMGALGRRKSTRRANAASSAEGSPEAKRDTLWRKSLRLRKEVGDVDNGRDEHVPVPARAGPARTLPSITAVAAARINAKAGRSASEAYGDAGQDAAASHQRRASGSRTIRSLFLRRAPPQAPTLFEQQQQRSSSSSPPSPSQSRFSSQSLFRWISPSTAPPPPTKELCRVPPEPTTLAARRKEDGGVLGAPSSSSSSSYWRLPARGVVATGSIGGEARKRVSVAGGGRYDEGGAALPLAAAANGGVRAAAAWCVDDDDVARIKRRPEFECPPHPGSGRGDAEEGEEDARARLRSWLFPLGDGEDGWNDDARKKAACRLQHEAGVDLETKGDAGRRDDFPLKQAAAAGDAPVRPPRRADDGLASSLQPLPAPARPPRSRARQAPSLHKLVSPYHHHHHRPPPPLPSPPLRRRRSSSPPSSRSASPSLSDRQAGTPPTPLLPTSSTQPPTSDSLPTATGSSSGRSTFGLHDRHRSNSSSRTGSESPTAKHNPWSAGGSPSRRIPSFDLDLPSPSPSRTSSDSADRSHSYEASFITAPSSALHTSAGPALSPPPTPSSSTAAAAPAPAPATASSYLTPPPLAGLLFSSGSYFDRSVQSGQGLFAELSPRPRSPRNPLGYRQLEAGQASLLPRLPSAFLARRLHPSKEDLEQSSSRRRPSRIPTDILDPHPFGVWISDRRGPTSLPPPPRSLPSSLSRRRGDQLLSQAVGSSSGSPACTTPATPVESRHVLHGDNNDKDEGRTTVEPLLRTNAPEAKHASDLDLGPGPLIATTAQSRQPPHRRSPSDQSVISSATGNRADHRTNRLSLCSSSQPSASAIAPSPSLPTSLFGGYSNAAGAASGSFVSSSRSPSTAVTTPSLGAASRTKHSHRSSLGGFSSRQHSVASIADFAPLPLHLSPPPPQPVLFGVEALTPHREEPSFSSDSSPTVTGASPRQDGSSRSSLLKAQGSTLSSLFRLARKQRSDASASGSRSDRICGDDERSFAASSALYHQREDSSASAARHQAQEPVSVHAAETAGSAGDRSSRLFRRSTASLRFRKSLAQLRPLLGRSAQSKTPSAASPLPYPSRSLTSEHEGSLTHSSRLTALAPSPPPLPPPTAFPPRKLPSVFSGASRFGQGGLRAQDVSETGFPLLLPATPGSEPGLSFVSEIAPLTDGVGGSRPSTSVGIVPEQHQQQHQQQQQQQPLKDVAATVSTIKRRVGDRLGSILTEQLHPLEPAPSSSSNGGATQRNAEPAARSDEDEMIKMASDEAADRQQQRSTASDTGHEMRSAQSGGGLPLTPAPPSNGTPRSSSDDYLPSPPTAAAEAGGQTGKTVPLSGMMAFPIRQRTDSRPTTSPRAAMLAAAAANAGHMPRPGYSVGASMPTDGPSGQVDLATSSDVDGREQQQHQQQQQQQTTTAAPSAAATNSGSRQSVRRGLGMRAESESAYTKRSSRLQGPASKHQQGHSKDDADGLSEVRRTEILKGKHSRGSSIATSIRRLMRRTSMRGKSQSISSLPPMLSPSRSSFKGLHPDLEVEDPARSSFGEFGEMVAGSSGNNPGRSRKDSLARSRSGKASSSAASIFAPFRSSSRDATSSSNKASKTRAKSGVGSNGSGPIAPLRKKDCVLDGDESFGNSGPLEQQQISGLPKSSRDLPFSFRAAHSFDIPSDVDGSDGQPIEPFTRPRPAPEVGQRELSTPDRGDVEPEVPGDLASKSHNTVGANADADADAAAAESETIEQLESTPRPATKELEEEYARDRPISDQTIGTDDGMGVALGGRSATDLSESLAMNSLTASGRQLVNPPGAEAARSDRCTSSSDAQNGAAALAAGGGGGKRSGLTARPLVGIPRIWQGIELADASAAGRSPVAAGVDGDDGGHDNDDDRAYSPVRPDSSEGLTQSRFDTATTASSFKTAESTPSSPRPWQLPSSRSASRPILPSLDVVRPHSPGSRGGFESPLSDLITSLEQRLDSRDGRSTAASAAYFDAFADSTESLSTRDVRPAIAAGPSSPGTETRPGTGTMTGPEPGTIALLPASTSFDRTPAVSNVEAADHGSLRAESDSNSTPTEMLDEDVRRNTFGEMGRLLAQLVSPHADAHAGKDADADADAETDAMRRGASHGTGLLIRDLDVSEIENHLAAVEAALQGHYVDRAALPVGNAVGGASGGGGFLGFTSEDEADFSMMAEDGSFSQHHAQSASEGDIPMPGAWSTGAKAGATTTTEAATARPFPSEEGRLALAPASQQAIADAVRQVRRAISSSHLQRRNSSLAEVTRTSEPDASHNDDHPEVDAEAAAVERADQTDSADEEEARDRLAQLGGDTTVRSEVTPVRAAKRRRDSMRDIEESYGRMLALVQSSAIGVTPSPVLKSDGGRFGDRPPHRRSKRESFSQSMQQAQQESPLSRTTAQAAERRERTKSTPVGLLPVPQIAATSLLAPLPPQPESTRALGARFIGQRSRGHSRINLSGVEVPASISLSGLMGMPKDEAAWPLRGRTSLSSFGSFRRVASESPGRLPRIDSPSLDVEQARDSKRHSAGAQAINNGHRQVQAQMQTLAAAQGREKMPAQQQQRRKTDAPPPSSKRYSQEQTITGGRASSGAGGTSPSATAKTLGTLRSQPAEPASSRQGHGQWDEGSSGVGARASYPRAGEASALLQSAVEASQERDLHGGSDGHGRQSAAAHHFHHHHASRSPTFESRPSSLSHHTGDASRSTDGHGHRRSRPTHPAATASAAAAGIAGTASMASPRTAVDLRSPAHSSLASGIRSRYEIGSIRDWSSQVSYRPVSSRSSVHHAQALVPQREDSSSTMGSSEYDALAALGMVPSSSASHTLVATMVRRHELERESLLDSLERTRAEVLELRTRNERLTLDLHAEVTRVLELEMELERRDDLELQTLTRMQQLERDVTQLTLESRRAFALSSVAAPATAAAAVDHRQEHAEDSSDSRFADERQQPPSNRTSQTNTGSDHSQVSGPHKVSSFGARPGHRSTLSETVLPAALQSPSMLASASREDAAATVSPLLAGRRPTGQERARPVSLFSGPSGLTRVSPALRDTLKLGDSRTALAAASSEQFFQIQADGGGDTGSAARTHTSKQRSTERSPHLRRFPSLLGLELNDDEADWALADEQPPEETSRDSLEDDDEGDDGSDDDPDESRGGGGDGDLSSFIANYAGTVPSQSMEFPTMSSPRRSNVAATAVSAAAATSARSPLSSGLRAPTSQQQGRPVESLVDGEDASMRMQTRGQGNGPGAAERRAGTSSSSIRSPSSSLSAPASASASVSTTASNATSRGGHRHVPGSVGLPTSSGLPRLANSSSLSHRTSSSTSSIRSTSSRLQQPGSLSGVPFGLHAANGPSLSASGVISASRQASTATTRSNYTNASTYTARSDSPVGSFVSNWRNVDSTAGAAMAGGYQQRRQEDERSQLAQSGTSSSVSTLKGPANGIGPTGGGTGGQKWIAGWYDTRRPGGYNPHSLSERHEALLNASFSSSIDAEAEAAPIAERNGRGVDR